MPGPRPAHLVRRGAVYQVRYRFPLDLAPALGLAEFRRSLQTSDDREARERCLQATVWFKATMAKLRTMDDAANARLVELMGDRAKSIRNRVTIYELIAEAQKQC